MLLRIVAWLYFWSTAALTLSFSTPSLLTVLSLCSPPFAFTLLCLLYALRRGYADQYPLNLSSASVCTKITGDSLPAAPGANIRSLLLQWGGLLLLSLFRESCETPCVLFCKTCWEHSEWRCQYVTTFLDVSVYSLIMFGLMRFFLWWSTLCITLFSTHYTAVASLLHNVKCLHFQRT